MPLRPALVALALLPVGCTPSSPAPDLAAASTRGAVDSPRALAVSSAQRGGAGLAQLTPDPRLARAARMQAAHMAAVDRMTHDGPGGHDFGARVRGVGLSGCRSFENIGEGHRTPEAIAAAWLASPKHRANLMQNGLRSSAVAYADAASGKRYWAQVFSVC